jgi:hypothetical protein
MNCATRHGATNGAADLGVRLEASPEGEDCHQRQAVTMVELLLEILDVDVHSAIDFYQQGGSSISHDHVHDALILAGLLSHDETLAVERLY